jgi:hypothetical protein
MAMKATTLAACLILALGCAAATAAEDPRPDWTPAPLVQQAYLGAVAVAPLRRQLAERALAYDRGVGSDGEALSHDDDLYLIEDLTRIADEAERARAIVVQPDSLAGACVEIALSGCSSPMGGYLNLGRGVTEGEPDRRLYWQLQDGFTPEDGVKGGFVLLQQVEGAWRPVVWDHQGYTYLPPVSLGRTDDGAELIAASGRYAGTGYYNADVIMRWTPGRGGGVWEQIDNWTWRDGLNARLPGGLEVWKGVNFNYEIMQATTALWRPNDGNCCPTGGSAVLSFKIEGEALVLDEVRVFAP